jgi:tetratricopeptide (TPR) repeat protein
MSKSFKESVWICLLLALSTLVIYWPITRHEFVNYDDTDYVTQNPYVQAGLSGKSMAWAWGSEVARNWHPVTMLSHILDCQLFGMKAGRHHLTSLLFHIANTLLLFLLLKHITGPVWRSGLVAALFALHPLHVESVAWVAERKDVLSTFFFLLTVGAYGRYAAKSEIRKLRSEGSQKAEARNPNHPAPITNHRSLYYWLALAFFALGLMSKPMLVTLPFVLLLLDFWPLQRLQLPALQSSKFKVQGSRFKISAPAGSAQSATVRQTAPFSRLIWDKVPFLLLSAASCVVTFLVQQKGGAVLDVKNFPVGTRVANALMSYVRYLGKMVWPEHLAALYLRKAPWPAWQVGLAAVFLVAVSVAVIRFARRRPYLAVGWFWYLGTLVPVIGLVQVGMQSLADRYTYIPLIGVFIMLAWGGWELVSLWRMPAFVPAIGAALVLVACMALTRAQLPYWQDSETLFQRMIAVTEGNYLAHYNLGNLYSRQDKLAEAVQQYEAAVRAEPNYAEAQNNLGTVLLRQGRFDEAIAHHSAAVRIRPEYLYYFNLANALAGAGRSAEAITDYQQALRLDPNSSAAHHNLGLALQAEGKNEEAMAEFRAALRLQPDYESAEHNLANRLADAGRLDEAMAHYVAALRLDPNHAESYNGLGICYAMQGKMPEAERQFRESVRLKPDNAGAQSNLANALGAQNKLEEAIPHYQKALQLAPQDFQTHFNFGVTLVRQGQRAEAKAHFAEALRLHPDYPEAQKALAELGSGAEPRK